MIKELILLIRLMFSSRPSDFVFKDLEVLPMDHFPFIGFSAMSWCGKIIHRKGSSSVNAITMNHEKIHVMQACYYANDSWLVYYWLYLWEYLKRGFFVPMTANYYCSKFESEAYANESNMDYCEYYNLTSINKYSIKGAKKLYMHLGGTSTAWKEYVKLL